MAQRGLRLLPLVLGLAGAGCGFIDQLTQPQGLAIQKFAATPREITPGGTSTLSWDVVGADSIEIDNGIGVVRAKGLADVRPGSTTRYTLTARSSGSTATSSVDVLVGAGSPSPSPSPSASPSPSPSPSVSPSPSPSPSPSASPSPSPSPSASPAEVSCGAPARSAGNCALSIRRYEQLPAGQCLEVTSVEVNQSCPVAFNTIRSLRFSVMGNTQTPNLRWQRAATSSDVLSPSEGKIKGIGETSVVLSDIVLDSTVTIEILHGDTKLLAFTLRHY